MYLLPLRNPHQKQKVYNKVKRYKQIPIWIEMLNMQIHNYNQNSKLKSLPNYDFNYLEIRLFEQKYVDVSHDQALFGKNM